MNRDDTTKGGALMARRLRFSRPERGVLTTTIDGVTYTATYYRSGGAGGSRPYWTVRTSDREAAEPGYDNDWYEPTEARVRAAIAGVVERQRRQRETGGRPTLGRAPRKPIAIKIDPDVLAALRREADAANVGYQTLINDVLARWARRSDAGRS